MLMGGYDYDGAPYFSNMYQWLYGYTNTMETDTSGIFLGNSKEYLLAPEYVAQVVKIGPDGEEEWNVDFSGIGSTVVRDIHIYENYLMSFSEEDLD